jgi:transposase
VLSVEDWAEIRRLHRSEGMPIKAIARVVGCSKNTVKAALAAQGPPRYRRRPRGSVVDEVEPRIRELLRAWPSMPATVIAERIGWSHSIRLLQPGVGASPGLSTSGPGVEDCVCGRGGGAVRLLVPSGHGAGRVRTVPALGPAAGADDGLWLLPVAVGAAASVPVGGGPVRRLVVASAGPGRGAAGAGLGRRGRDRAVAPRRQRADREHPGVPRDAGHQGADLPAGRSGGQGPGRTRQRVSGDLVPARARVRLAGGLQHPADRLAGDGERPHQAGVGCAPTERVEADRAAMLTLPPVAPVTGWRQSLRLPRDHYVRLDANDYSVHPAAVGRRVEVVADLDRVRVVTDGRVVTCHDRCWARHQTITDPAHLQAATTMRAGRLAVLTPPARTEVEQRALTDYDAAFGLDATGQGNRP